MDAVATFQPLIDRYLAAYEAHDAAGCAALYAAEIEAEHRRWFEDGETDKTMAVTRAGIDGDLGYCLVHFEANVPGPKGGTDRFCGTSLNAMERRSDGVWTIKLTSLNELVEHDTDQDK